MLIGEYLRDCRVATDISQYELAKHLGYSSAQLISNVERGLCGPPWHVLSDWAKYVGARKRKVKQILIEDYEKKISKFI